MEINEYQKLAMTTLNPQIEKEKIIINAVMGLSAESGEATDLVKKHLFQGHDLNRSEMIEELGDIAWYLAEAATALDIDLSEILEANIEKLKKRFPEGFSAERSMHRYRFYGWEKADFEVDCPEYPGIRNVFELYDALKECWSYETCAPRMADDWSKGNPSLGQCSITSFLVQEILGGKVYGIELPDGSYHCFNVLEDRIFDLTSEQFEKRLDYGKSVEQDREKHFSKEEKYQRYLLLKERLREKCKEKDTD
ncbi:MAG: nucleoside triphosphate pyrophosphohydrolase family protein [Erysipelotrichaceae bacterium]|nr:nucleoside triphosphate pyrophosphohydrolase family protein [Erysipelotrichaceae bacterium]